MSRAGRPSLPHLLVAAQRLLLLSVLLAGMGRLAPGPLQGVTANDCKSSNAKVLFGAVQPHGFSLSTL